MSHFHYLKQASINVSLIPSNRIFPFDQNKLHDYTFQFSDASPVKRGRGKRSHFEFGFTFLYYICVCPFRPIWHEDKVVLKKNKFQQAVCLALHFGAFMYQLKDVINECLEGVEANPVQIFTICFSSIDLFYIVCGIFCIWRKENEVIVVLELTAKLHPRGSGCTKLKRAFIFIVPLLLSIYEIFIFGVREELVWKVNDNCNILRWISNKPTAIGNPYAQCFWHDGIIQSAIYLMLLANLLVYNYLDAILMLIAVTSVEVARDEANFAKHILKCTKDIEKNNKLERIDICKLRNLFFRKSNVLKEYFDALNSFGEALFFCWFCTFTPWISLHLMEIFPGVTHRDAVAIVYKCVYIVYYGVLLLVSVEAKRLVDKFKDGIYQTILHHDPFVESSHAYLSSIEYILQNVGIRGGPFFQLTFPFLGNVFGAVVTYAFLALQFHVTPTQKAQ